MGVDMRYTPRFNGGPVYYTDSPNSRRKRGLRQSNKQPHGPVRILMKNGKHVDTEPKKTPVPNVQFSDPDYIPPWDERIVSPPGWNDPPVKVDPLRDLFE